METQPCCMRLSCGRLVLYLRDFGKEKTMNYVNIAILALVAVFTGLYWWDAKRTFLLELGRVVLWFRLEESEDQGQG